MEMELSSKGLVLGKVASNGHGEASKLEVMPCGMLVQKRDPDEDAFHVASLIRVKVSYGRSTRYIAIKAHSTFGDLKKALVQETGLQPEQQRLLYKGKEKNNRQSLDEAGLKNKSKLVLVEDRTGWEKRLIELRKTEVVVNARKTVADVQQLVDKLSGQIASVEAAVANKKKLPESELVALTDLLMHQFVKLDESKVDGEVNVQKKILMRRVQKYVETLDALKTKNDERQTQIPTQKIQNGRAQMSHNVMNARGVAMNPQMHILDAAACKTVVTTSWETFGMNTKMETARPVNEPLLIQWD